MTLIGYLALGCALAPAICALAIVWSLRGQDGRE